MRVAPGALPVVSVDRSSPQPLYRQLYEGYRNAIAERRLTPGERIPSTRGLAAELRISRIPVLNAFEQLLAEGYFESRIGSGTFVAGSPVERVSRPDRSAGESLLVRRAPRTISRRAIGLVRAKPGPWLSSLGPFNMGEPPVDRFPLGIWSRLVGRHARRLDSSQLHYPNPMGLASLREAVAEYLRTARGVSCEAERILIVSGSQQALDLSARVLADRGSPVWIEDPAYFGARNVLNMAETRLVPVPVDAEGLNVSAGIARCPKPRAIFVTPSHQFPLGVTMSASRRLQLLDYARQTGAWVVEDDYDSEYRYGNMPIAALQGLDRDSRVLYVGTFTKILFPAIRLGYMVVPEDLIPPFFEARRAADTCPPLFLQAVLGDFIREGHFARHIRRTRVICRERRTALIEALEREVGGVLEVLGDSAGMYLSVALPAGWRDREIAHRAVARGVAATPLSESYVGTARRNGLILGYGGTTAEKIRVAVSRLRDVLRDYARDRPRGPSHAAATGRSTAGSGQSPAAARRLGSARRAEPL
jgi:GntR family transcriptional regulator/MocR family aminotransferase